MSLFDSREPVFLKDNTSTAETLKQLNKLLPRVTDRERNRLERDIKLIEAGERGENQVAFELANSHLPMYVLRDLNLEFEGLSSQIDFLVICPYTNIVIECKNLFGDIEINSRGAFIRTFGSGKYLKKEGIYSPVTQNERHRQLMKAIRKSEHGAIIGFGIDKWFDACNKSVIVLANAKTILHDRYANKEIKNQVIRADALIDWIKSANEDSKKSGAEKASRKEMERAAQAWIERSTDIIVDVSGKYELKDAQIISDSKEIETSANRRQSCINPLEKAPGAIFPCHNSKEEPPLCPLCGKPMALRVAKRGERAGKFFYGCSQYPHCHGIVNID
jgi:hypothetical protein